MSSTNRLSIRFGMRRLEAAFDGQARRPARSLIDRHAGTFNGDASSLLVKGGVEPPHSTWDHSQR